MASAKPKKLLIYGHSQSRNLGVYIRTHNKDKFKFDSKDIIVECEGDGGLIANDLINEKSKRFINSIC